MNFRHAGEGEMVCPRCGRPAHQMDFPHIVGLDGYGLLAYPLYVSRERLGIDGEPHDLIYIGGAGRAKEFAVHVNIYQCPCGALLCDEALIDARTWAEENRPEPILEGD